eukprot:SAG31_NODE_13342_length_875_cov_9.918814_1_plen_204_part_10
MELNSSESAALKLLTKSWLFGASLFAAGLGVGVTCHSAVARSDAKEEPPNKKVSSAADTEAQPQAGACDKSSTIRTDEDIASLREKILNEELELALKELDEYDEAEPESAEKAAGQLVQRQPSPQELADQGSTHGLPPGLETKLREIFNRVDRDQDGGINRRELILALRRNPDICGHLKLPMKIRQEDGSRDKVEAFFQAIDSD